MNGLKPLSRKAVDLFKRQYQQTYLPYDNKRTLLDRIIDVANIGQYVSAGAVRGLIRDDMSVIEGIVGGLRAGNFFGKGYEKGEHQYSQVLDDLGWKPKSFAGKAARGIVGWVADVMLDPLNYVSFGTSSLIKGSGKVGAKATHGGAKLAQELAEHGITDVTKGLTKEAAESIIRKQILKRPALEMSEKAISESAEKLVKEWNKLIGLQDASRGVNISLANVPFGEKIFGKHAQKSINLVSGETMQALGDKTLAPLYGKLRDVMMGKHIGKLFETRSALYELSKTDPGAVWDMLKSVEIQRGLTKNRKAIIKALKEQSEVFNSLTPDERLDLINLMEDKSAWSRVQQLIKFSETQDAAAYRVKLDKLYKDASLKLDDLLKKKNTLLRDEVLKSAEVTKAKDELSALNDEWQDALIEFDVRRITEKNQLEAMQKALQDELDNLTDTKPQEILETVSEKVQKTRVVDELVPMNEEEAIRHYVNEYKKQLKDFEAYNKSKPKENYFDNAPLRDKAKVVGALNNYIFGEGRRVIALNCRNEQFNALLDMVSNGASKAELEEFIEKNPYAFSWWANEVYPFVGEQIGYGKGKPFASWRELYNARASKIRLDVVGNPLTTADAQNLVELKQLELKRIKLLKEFEEEFKNAGFDGVKAVKQRIIDDELADLSQEIDIKPKRGYADVHEERRGEIIKAENTRDVRGSTVKPDAQAQQHIHAHMLRIEDKIKSLQDDMAKETNPEKIKKIQDKIAKNKEILQSLPRFIGHDPDYVKLSSVAEEMRNELLWKYGFEDISDELMDLRFRIRKIADKEDMVDEVEKLKKRLNREVESYKLKMRYIENIEREANLLLKNYFNVSFANMSPAQRNLLYSLAEQDAIKRSRMAKTGVRELLHSDGIPSEGAIRKSFKEKLNKVTTPYREKLEFAKANQHKPETIKKYEDIIAKLTEENQQELQEALARRAKQVDSILNKDKVARQMLRQRISKERMAEVAANLHKGFEVHFKTTISSDKGKLGNFSWKKSGGYEVSSKGDKRFSAFYARLKDGRTIEEAYQLDVKGYRKFGNDPMLGKGKPPLDENVNLYDEYLKLWKKWGEENPDLIKELQDKAIEYGGVLSDSFATTEVNQAHALSDYLNSLGDKFIGGIRRGIVEEIIVDEDNYFAMVKFGDEVKKVDLKDIKAVKFDAKLVDIDGFLAKSKITSEFVARQEDTLGKLYKRVPREEVYYETVQKQVVTGTKPSDEFLQKQASLKAQLSDVQKAKDDLAKALDDEYDRLQKMYEERVSNVQRRIVELEHSVHKVREELGKLEKSDAVEQLMRDVQKYQEALADDDAFETWVRATYGDNIVDAAIKLDSPSVGEIVLNPDVEASDKIKQLAQRLRNAFNEMGREEVGIGKLQQEQLDNMALWYFPHILDEGGQKLFANKEEILKKFPNWGDNFGYGMEWNPFAKSRKIVRVPAAIDDAGKVVGWIENPTVRQINDAMRMIYGDVLKGKNVFSEDVADVFLTRALKNVDLMYDNEYMHTMLDIFGDAYDGVAKEGYKPIMNYGKLREVSANTARLRLSVEISDAVDSFIRTNKIMERISRQAIEEMDKLDKIGRFTYDEIFNRLLSKEIKEFIRAEYPDAVRKQLYRRYLEEFISVSQTQGLLEDLAVPMVQLNDEQIKGINLAYDEAKEMYANKIKKQYVSWEKNLYFRRNGVSMPQMMADSLYDEPLDVIRDSLNRYLRSYTRQGNNVAAERMQRILNKIDWFNELSDVQVRNVNEAIVQKANQSRKLQIMKDQSRFLQLYDKLTHLIKLNQTTVLPSFHIRNKMADTFNSWLQIGADAVNIDFQKKAWQAVTNDGEVFGALKIVGADGTVSAMDWAEVYRLAADYDVIDKGMFAVDLGVETAGGKGVLKRFGVPGKFDPTDARNFVLYKAGSGIGSLIENQNRLVHFASELSRGMSPEDAAESVNKFLFDYSDLTAFEQGVMKRIIPYYTWLRKNAPLQLEMMMEHPEKYRNIGKLLNAIEGMVDEDDKINKAFVNDFALDWVQTPFSVINPQGRKEPVLWNPNLPFMDISRIPDPTRPMDSLKDIFTQMNPLIKTPIEQIVNRNFFFESPIVKEGESQVAKRVDHILSQLAMYGVAKDFVQKRGTDLALHTLNTFSGVKMLSYDYDAYKAMRIKEMLEEAKKPTDYSESVGDVIRRIFSVNTLVEGVKVAVSLATSAAHSLADLSMENMPLRADEYQGALRPISESKYNSLSDEEKALYTPPDKQTAMAYHIEAVRLAEEERQKTGVAKRFLWGMFDMLNIGERNAPYEYGEVVKVIDGDTFDVKIGDKTKRVRMLLIDTPEIGEEYEEGSMPYGQEAKEYTSEYLLGKDVRIIFDRNKEDKYGRTLGYVEVDGVDVNEELLKQGLARTGYILNPPYKRLGSYQQTEKKAKQSKQGIWSVQDYATAHGYDVSAVERALNKKRQDIRNMWQNK